MNLKSMNLAWIVVHDLQKAIQFYTNVGLKLMDHNEQYGWAELEGQEKGGARIGLAQKQLKSEDQIEPGQNAVLTFTVENLEEAVADLKEKGAKLIGKVQEIPGHIKLQMAADNDGNHFQLVELLGSHKIK